MLRIFIECAQLFLRFEENFLENTVFFGWISEDSRDKAVFPNLSISDLRKAYIGLLSSFSHNNMCEYMKLILTQQFFFLQTYLGLINSFTNFN